MRSAERAAVAWPALAWQGLRAGAWRRAGLLLCAGTLAACAGVATAPQKEAKAPAAPAAAAPEKPALVPDLPVGVINSFEAAQKALQDGHLAEAEAGFLALTRSNPDLGGPHANLGIVYRRADKLDQAVSELERAVQCNPKQPVFWNQLGIAYRMQGQFSKARDAYEHALAIDPSYPAPILNLGILFDLYLWDSKKALELYDRYLALTPGGDAKVGKWIADLKNRNREAKAGDRKEKE